MHRTRVKICGMMRPEDAATAAAAGADAIGLIFHPPAKRNITPDRAQQIIAMLPPFVTPVGVFADAAAAQIIDISGALGLRIVQLNGNETPQDVSALRTLKVIKAIRVKRGALAEEVRPWRAALRQPQQLDNLIGFVMEPGETGVAGGSGVANDWASIRAEIDAGTFDLMPPIIAAGGLTPQNVAGVVKTIRPWAVDVSTGVEASLGEKSAEKIDQFIRAVRSADELQRS